MSGAVVVLRPAAASAMVWRFAGSVIRAARSRSRHGLWVLTKKGGGRCRVLRQTHPR